jgi:hypothetical protein
LNDVLQVAGRGGRTYRGVRRRGSERPGPRRSAPRCRPTWLDGTRRPVARTYSARKIVPRSGAPLRGTDYERRCDTDWPGLR